MNFDSVSLNIKKVYAFQFFLGLHFIGGIIMPFFTIWGGITFSQVLILQAFYVVSIILLEIPSGAIADRIGRRVSMAIGALTFALSTLIYTSYPHFLIFLLAEFLWAVGDAFLSGADEAILYDSLKKTKKEKLSKKSLARMKSFRIGGIMIAAPIGSIFAAMIGLREAVMIMAIPFMIAFFIALTLKEVKIKEKVQETNYFRTMLDGVKYFKNHRMLNDLAIDGVSIGSIVFMIIWLYQLLLLELSLPIIFFGFVSALITGTEIIMLNSFGFLEKLFGSKKRLLDFMAFVPAICFILLGIVNFLPLVILLIAITGGVGISRLVLFTNYMHKHIESHNRATVISTVSMLYNLSLAVVYSVLSVVVLWSVRNSFIIMGLLVLLLMVLSRVNEDHLKD